MVISRVVPFMSIIPVVGINGQRKFHSSTQKKKKKTRAPTPTRNLQVPHLTLGLCFFLRWHLNHQEFCSLEDPSTT